MLLRNFSESLLLILWPLALYIPILIWAFVKKRNFYIYLFISILQMIIPTLLLIPSPSGNGSDMIGYGAVIIFIIGVQLFFVALTLLILLGTFLYRLYNKRQFTEKKEKTIDI